MCSEHDLDDRHDPQGSAQDFPWHLGVYDAHCHPTDTMESVCGILEMKAKVLTLMATRAQDQDLVAELSRDLGVPDRSDLESKESGPRKGVVIPSFGWHPWFSHHLYDDTDDLNSQPNMSNQTKLEHYQSVLKPRSDDLAFLQSLPEPRSLSVFLEETRKRLVSHDHALVGEVGLDRSFRIPTAWLSEDHDQRDISLTPGGREGRKLSPYHVNLEHQKKILLAQLRLAGELGRPVSCHSVATHGIIFDTLRETWKGHERRVVTKSQLKRHPDAPGAVDPDEEDDAASTIGPRPFPPRVCLHSFSGPPETVKQYLNPSIPCEFFFSFSTAINFSSLSEDKVRATIKEVPEDRLLVESDLHIAGTRMDQHLEDIVRKLCDVRGWTLDKGVSILGQNWKRFVFGT